MQQRIQWHELLDLESYHHVESHKTKDRRRIKVEGRFSDLDLDRMVETLKRFGFPLEDAYHYTWRMRRYGYECYGVVFQLKN